MFAAPINRTMFVLSKVYLYLTNPGFFLPVLLVVGALLLKTRWRYAGRRLIGFTVGVILVLSVFPIGSWMIWALENRFPPVKQLVEPVAGIIVLGGIVNQFMTAARGQPSLGEGAERLTEFIALARRHPDARLVFTGGSGHVMRQDLKEADVARLFMDRIGFDSAPVIFESRSRNTLENAVFSRELLKPAPSDLWVLVTSARHMPRAVGVFRKAGWRIIAYPVDFGTYPDFRFSIGLNMASGVTRFGTALREWMGLLVYRMLGRIDDIFPGPAGAR